MIIVRRGPVAAPITATLFLSLSLAASACTDRRAEVARDHSPPPADAPPSLGLAHEAYLAGDYIEMSERLRDTIVDPRAGELALDNAFALLESAYEAAHGQLPGRTALPSFVHALTFGVLNGAYTWGAHRLVFLDLRMEEGRAVHVKDIRLTRLVPGSTGEPILALADKRGALRESHERNEDHLAIDVRNLAVLPERGAFAIQVVFDDAPAIDTFVLANKLVASAQPELIVPDVGQVFQDPHPELVWRPFRSPELTSWEHRSVSVAITSEGKGDSPWSLYKWAPGDLARARVGDPGTPAAALEPGSYWLSLFYQEGRTFGGVEISRASERGRPFSVVR